MLDLLRFAIAIIPVATYTAVIGVISLSKTPSVRNGATDFLLLAMAMVGIISIGPIELFFPRAASTLLGPWVWIVLIALYFFVVLLIALNLPLKLLFLGISLEDARQAIVDCLQENDIDHEWRGELLSIPAMGLWGSLEELRGSNMLHLISTGSKQNPTGWFTLERLLGKHLQNHRVTKRSNAFRWFALSACLFGLSMLFLLMDMPRLREAMLIVFGNLSR